MMAGASCARQPTEPYVIEGTTTGAGMEIGFSSESGPPTSGENRFEVTVKENGSPVDDATITIVFSMPAMPSMNMPEMHTSARLQPAGGGRYRGSGQLSMAGTWNVRVTVTRNGHELGSKRLSIVAR